MSGMAEERKTRQRKTEATASGSARDAERLRDQVPPHNVDAEKSVIASVLLLNNAYDDVCDVLLTRMFYIERHRKIWDAVADLLLAARAVDAVTLAEELSRRGEFEDCGGAGYLLELMDTVPHAGHAKHYADIVSDHYIARSLADACSETIKDVYRVSENGRGGEMRSLLEDAEGRVFSIIERNAPRGQVVTLAEALEGAFRKLGDRHAKQSDHPGLAIGLNDLDNLTGGFEPEQLIVLGARPSMGKSAAMGNWALHIVKRVGAVLFFTLEMSKIELAERLVCAESRVSFYDMRSGNIDDEGQGALAAAEAVFRPLPLFILDEQGQTVSSMLSTARRIARRHPLAAVFVDYLQLIEPPRDGVNRQYSREQIVANISRRLKFMAKELQVPVIVGAQLNRGVEDRPDPRPRLSDLRESGAIEQDADIVIFLHRPEVYNPENRVGEADFIVAKQRSGPKGTAVANYIGKQMRFTDYDTAGGPPSVQKQLEGF